MNILGSTRNENCWSEAHGQPEVYIVPTIERNALVLGIPRGRCVMNVPRPGDGCSEHSDWSRRKKGYEERV